MSEHIPYVLPDAGAKNVSVPQMPKQTAVPEMPKHGSAGNAAERVHCRRR